MDTELTKENILPHESIEIPGEPVLPHIYPNIELEEQLTNPVIVVVGPNGSGKDTVLDIVKDQGLVKRVLTATTRRRRFKVLDPNQKEEITERLNQIEDMEEYNSTLDSLESIGSITAEALDAYVWMQWPTEGTDQDEYFRQLMEKYELIEFDFHYCNLYGLPKSSLSSDNETCNGLPVIRTDLPGMLTLNSVLKAYGFAPINIGVVPDNWKQVEDAMRGRASNCDEKDVQERLNSSIEQFDRYKEILHFYIHNSRIPSEGVSGLDITVEALKLLMESINRRKIVRE